MKLPNVKTITLSEYTASYTDPSDSMYVVNRSPQNADIILNAVGDNGRSVAIMLPYTFAPLDITVFAPRAGLITSSEFRRLLASNLVSIVDNNSAEVALRHPLVKKEVERIFNINNLSTSDGTSGDITLGTHQSAPQQDTDDPYTHINPVVSQLLELGDDDSVEDERIETRFLQQLALLTHEDLEFIRSKTRRGILSDLVVAELGAEEEA